MLNSPSNRVNRIDSAGTPKPKMSQEHRAAHGFDKSAFACHIGPGKEQEIVILGSAEHHTGLGWATVYGIIAGRQ